MVIEDELLIVVDLAVAIDEVDGHGVGNDQECAGDGLGVVHFAAQIQQECELGVSAVAQLGLILGQDDAILIGDTQIQVGNVLGSFCIECAGVLIVSQGIQVQVL